MERHRPSVGLRFTAIGERSLDLDQVHGHIRHGCALQALSDDRRGTGGANHIRVPQRRIDRIEGHVGGARFEDGQQTDGQFD